MENKEVPMTINQLQERFYLLRDSINSLLLGKGEVGGKSLINLTSIRLKWYGENQFTLETCVRREPEDDLPFCKITTYEVEYVRSTKNPGDWELADPDIDEKIAANCVNDAVTIFTEGLFKEVPVKAPETEKEEKNDFFKKFDVYRGEVIDEGVEYPYLPIVDSYLSLVRTTVWDKLHRATTEAELSKITRGTELDYLNYDVETKLEDHFLDENVCCYNYGIEVAIGYRDKMCAMVREYRATVGYVSFNDDKVSIDPIPSIMVNIERFVNEIVKHLNGGARAESK
jgi:hypothetical protein|nr:MAG TPA: hypothetical protein [Caudoviricetes sp.]